MIARLAGLALMGLVATACIDKPTEHRVRANAYLRGGDAKAALAEIDQGLQHKADDMALLTLRGKALFELERYDEAKAAYLAAEKQGSGPELAEVHVGLAMVAMRQDDMPAAKQRFETLVELNARDADARLNLARVCLQMEDMKCAIEHGEEAGHLRGNSEDVLFTLGRIYVVAKKYPEAEKTFMHICEVIPNASSCPYGVALVAAQQGDKEKALAKLNEAIQRKLPNPDKIADDPLLAPLKSDVAFQKLAGGS